MKITNRLEARARRHARIRRKVAGTRTRPRMCVRVSGSHVYVQFIDDDAGVTLASASSLGSGLRLSVAAAGEVGKKAAEAALKQGIAEAVFDRGGHKYHGRVKAVAEAARSAGIRI